MLLVITCCLTRLHSVWSSSILSAVPQIPPATCSQCWLTTSHPDSVAVSPAVIPRPAARTYKYNVCVDRSHITLYLYCKVSLPLDLCTSTMGWATVAQILYHHSGAETTSLLPSSTIERYTCYLTYNNTLQYEFFTYELWVLHQLMFNSQ
jgi:hypothetical protein